MYEYYVILAAPVRVFFHSHSSSVSICNELNITYLCEQNQFHLGVLDLDLSLQSEKHAAIIDANSDEEKIFNDAWKRSNRLSLMFMQIV